MSIIHRKNEISVKQKASIWAYLAVLYFNCKGSWGIHDCHSPNLYIMDIFSFFGTEIQFVFLYRLITWKYALDHLF